jgi:hypothetical protein
MKINLDEMIHLEAQKRRQLKMRNNIVNALMMKMHINALDSNLVFWVGNGYESTKREALGNWAQKELAKMDINPEFFDSVINRLEYSLTRLINRKMGN